MTTWTHVPWFTKETSETCLPGAQMRGQGLQGWKDKRMTNQAGREKAGPYHLPLTTSSSPRASLCPLCLDYPDWQVWTE